MVNIFRFLFVPDLLAQSGKNNRIFDTSKFMDCIKKWFIITWKTKIKLVRDNRKHTVIGTGMIGWSFLKRIVHVYMYTNTVARKTTKL